MSLILITGATGYIGSAVLNTLANSSNFELRATARSAINDIPPVVATVQVSSLDSETRWSEAVQGVDTVVHAAARVHMTENSAQDALAEFRRVNVAGTLNLARQAASADVKRFIFISSIKVNGEGRSLGMAYGADDLPAPVDPYGISKMEAEQGLQQISHETGMEFVIIRPPLVYGTGVKANFQSMMRWVAWGVPLPLGAVNNKRSYIALDNLVDFIQTCILHPKAANQTFLVADGEDLSTPELLRCVGQVSGKIVRLIPVPTGLLHLGATLIGKKAIAQRLCGSLQVDISKARDLLGWNPPLSVKEGLRRTVGGMGQ